MLVLRSIFFALLLPGSATVVIPYFILSRRGVPHWDAIGLPGLVAVALGATILIRCIVDFARVGRGTLAPVDPPRALVIRGLYRYVRNPMYVGVVLVLLGEAALFRSTDLLLYSAVFFLVVNLFVILYEEPALRARFGEPYEQYRRSVGRWIPRRNAMKRAGLIALLLILDAPLPAQMPRTLSANDQRARDIFEQLININTTGSSGSTTVAANAMAKRLTDAGFPAADVQVIGPAASKNYNLVARFRSTGMQKPILLLAHIDVVEAKKEDWSVDPFTFLEREGFFYGRGTMDVKDGAAILVATLARLKQEGYRPNRDLILALTTGEEGGSDYNGVQWLLANHRDLIDAAFVINMDAGDPVILNGKRLMRSVQASEKVYVTFKLEVHNPGGHSSLPTNDNAIYRLAAALGRLSAYEFPAQLNEITRASFARWGQLQQGQLATDMAAVAGPTPDTAAIRRLSSASPLYNAQLRTTCVATELAGGHAENALPQSASATVNCRMLPGTPSDEVQSTLSRVVNDTTVTVSVVTAAVPSPPSPLKPEIMDPVERVTKRLWNIPVVPVMETGATDGLYLRNAGIPVYGVSGVFVDINDIRAHGRDERIGVQDYYDGAEYIYQLVKAVTSR